MKENAYQSDLKKTLKKLFPDCEIHKLDPNDIQGSPDLLVLNGDRWATLECKKSEKEKHRPNQDFYVDKHNKMSFSSFIYPENEKEVLHDLAEYFKK